jgi:hypothetical protein
MTRSPRAGKSRERGYVVSDGHVFTDQAASGARKDRGGLAALLAAADGQPFEIVLVDDLSRLARDNYLMLSILAELRFNGVRVVSVADGLDSEDEEATLGIQVRGIFNELQLRDLRKKSFGARSGRKSAASSSERGPSDTSPFRSASYAWTRRAPASRRVRDGHRAPRSGRCPASLPRIRRRDCDRSDREAIQRRSDRRQVSICQAVVPGDDPPHAQERKVCWSLDLEPD